MNHFHSIKKKKKSQAINFIVYQSDHWGILGGNGLKQEGKHFEDVITLSMHVVKWTRPDTSYAASLCSKQIHKYPCIPYTHTQASNDSFRSTIREEISLP